jgi:hypothetical protein
MILVSTGRGLLRISLFEIYGEPPRWQKAIEDRWRTLVQETNLPAATGLLIFCTVLTLEWRSRDPNGQVWPELAGLTFDIFFVLIVFSLFEFRRQKWEANSRQREIIDDYKRWNGEEARVRLAGAIRRLSKNGVHDLDLSGIVQDFSFTAQGIGSLRRTVFYDGTWGEPLADKRVSLQQVTFDHVDCSEVTFSAFDPLEGILPYMTRYAEFRDCSFVRSSLRGAAFIGAALTWSEKPPASHYEVVEDEEGGEPASAQVTSGPFDGADLSGASFKGCIFENADFRGAEGLESADFSGAKGLAEAIFDDDETKAAVLKASEGAHRLSDFYQERRGAMTR